MFHLGVAFMAEGSPLVLDEAKVRQFLQQEVTVVTVHLNKSRKNGQNCVATWWQITIPAENVKIHLSTHFAAEALWMPGWLHSLQTKGDSK